MFITILTFFLLFNFLIFIYFHLRTSAALHATVIEQKMTIKKFIFHLKTLLPTIKKIAKNKIKLRAFLTTRSNEIFRTLAQKILSFYIESSQKEQCERAREQMSENQLILIVMLIIYFPSIRQFYMNARDEYNHM